MRANRSGSVLLLFFAASTSLLAMSLLPAQAVDAESAGQAEARRQPTAAEMSKKETVASAFLRDLEYQEYEVRSAAEAMPEARYGYRPPPRANSRAKSRSSVQPKCALLRSK